MIATKTANSFLVGISQISGYTFFGHLYGKYWVYGIVLGLGATLGNIIGKRFLKRMKDESFRKILILFMVLSGGIMLYRYFI